MADEAKDKKTKGEELKEKLYRKKENSWNKLNKDAVMTFSNEYKNFLNGVKTERENVEFIEKQLVKEGFKKLSDYLNGKEKIPANINGLKVYDINRNKSLAAAVIKDNYNEGSNLVVSHIDAPRIDIKPEPMYEDIEFAMLKTHYYGGIKKYQWMCVPLSLHGVVIKKDGTKVDISIGEGNDEPVFVFPDVLIHLSRNVQGEKKLLTGFDADSHMNLIMGSMPFDDEKVDEKVKLHILSILNEKYGIIEEDFMSAELELVPAGKARDVGLDKSILGAYGHDDRICAYTSFRALLDQTLEINRTAIMYLADKEEIGSTGNTGARSRYMVDFMGDLLAIKNKDYTDKELRAFVKNSTALSADVNAALNPNFKGVMDSHNAAKFGHGVCLTKYTGSGGKGGTSDASAETVHKIKSIFDKEKVPWQMGLLGKVDEGGGGTIAMFLADLNMEVIDCGVALISMHSPFELASKADLYSTYLAYKAFYKKS